MRVKIIRASAALIRSDSSKKGSKAGPTFLGLVFLSLGLVIEAHGALVDAVCLNSVPPSKPTGVICTAKPGLRVKGQGEAAQNNHFAFRQKDPNSSRQELDRNSEEEPVKHFSRASSEGSGGGSHGKQP